MSRQHKQLLNRELHEPKLIPTATTADAGKVLTPSTVTNGVAVLRTLTRVDLRGDKASYQFTIPDATVVGTTRTGYMDRAIKTYSVYIAELPHGAVGQIQVYIGGVLKSTHVCPAFSTGSVIRRFDVTLPSELPVIDLAVRVSVSFGTAVRLNILMATESA